MEEEAELSLIGTIFRLYLLGVFTDSGHRNWNEERNGRNEAANGRRHLVVLFAFGIAQREKLNFMCRGKGNLCRKRTPVMN